MHGAEPLVWSKEHMETVRDGAGIVLAMTIMQIVLVAGLLGVFYFTSLQGPVEHGPELEEWQGFVGLGFTALLVLFGAIWLFGFVRYTRPSPDERGWTARRWLRLVLLLMTVAAGACGALLVVSLVHFLNRDAAPISSFDRGLVAGNIVGIALWSVVGLIAPILLGIAQMRYARRIALICGEEAAARRATTLSYVTPLCQTIGAIILIGPLLGLVFILWSYVSVRAVLGRAIARGLPAT